MDHRRVPTKSIMLAALLLAMAVFYLAPMLATAAGTKARQDAYNKAVLQVKIAMTSKGMVVTPTSLKPGNHLLTIKNSTSEPRGVEMIGIDSANSPTVRYTTILKPGKSEQFRWFFAQGNTVYVRDIMGCTHDKRTCMVVTFGKMHKAIWVK